MEETINEIMKRLDEIKTLTLISAKTILTDQEASIYTGFSRDYLYRLRVRHEIAFSGHHRSVRYLKTDLDRFMMSHREKPNYEIEEEANRRLLGIKH